MIHLDSTSDTLRIITTTTASTQYAVRYSDVTSSAIAPGESNGTITTATTTTVLSSPAASTVRQVADISVFNASGNATQSVTVVFYNGTTERNLYKCSLRPGDRATFDTRMGWFSDVQYNMLPSNCNQRDIQFTRSKTTQHSINAIGLTAQMQPNVASFEPDPLPDLWTDLTAGISLPTSRAIDNTVNAGGLNTNGQGWMSAMKMLDTTQTNTSAASNLWGVCDILGQYYVTNNPASNPVATSAITLPSRDLSLSGNGVGVIAAYGAPASAAGPDGTEALAAYTDPVGTTISYTNSAGTSGRTGTLLAFGTSANHNAYYIFTMQAGDKGIKSIESFTWSATGVPETWIMTLLLKPISFVPTKSVADSMAASPALAWKKLAGSECMVPCSLTSVTTNASGNYTNNFMQLEFTQS